MTLTKKLLGVVPKNIKAQTGFTLIELLVVVAILAILASFLFSGLIIFHRRSLIDATGQEIINTLRLAQNKTLSSEGASSFGVHFATWRFVLFKGSVYNPSASDNEIHDLLAGMEISQIGLGGGSDVVFERLTGNAEQDGFIRAELIQDSTKNTIIYIDSSGAISSLSSSASDTNRLKDTRHVHVLYSQSTKNATTLTLTFPNDGVIQNISYQGGLNPGKTQFNWSGTISVAGADQKITIHSHALTDSATLFCLHRDRRDNSKALNISLDSQNLINYTATGITTKGTSLWAGNPEIQ